MLTDAALVVIIRSIGQGKNVHVIKTYLDQMSYCDFFEFTLWGQIHNSQ